MNLEISLKELDFCNDFSISKDRSNAIIVMLCGGNQQWQDRETNADDFGARHTSDKA